MANEDVEQKPQFKITSLGGAEIRNDESHAVAERLLAKPATIHLFTDGPYRSFDLNQLSQYLKKTFGPHFTIENHGDLVQFAISKNPDKKGEIIAKLAEAKLASKRFGFESTFPLTPAEKIKLEEEIEARDPQIPLAEFADSQKLGPDRISSKHYYDTHTLADAYRIAIPAEMQENDEKKRNTAIIITGRGIGEVEGWQQMIHMRGGFSSGSVAIISTTGLVEAPGKPLELERAYRMGGSLPMFDNPDYNARISQVLKDNNNVADYDLIQKTVSELFRDRMLSPEDPQINEAVKGMTLSMILSTLGEYGRPATCSTSDLSRQEPDTERFCRLHDSHWQEELMATQINKDGKPEFCGYHEELFKDLKAEK